MGWCSVTDTETNTRQAALFIVCVFRDVREHGGTPRPVTAADSTACAGWPACHTQTVVIKCYKNTRQGSQQEAQWASKAA